MYEHVEPDRVTKDDLRFYRTPYGEFPSVTTVLGKTKQDGIVLRKWKAKATPEMLAEVEQKKIDGAARGTILHEMVENYLINGIEGSGPWWESIEPVVKRVTKVHLIESALWHPGTKSAGTIDLFGDIDGVPETVDWKTAAKPKRDEWIEDYQLQACAYTAFLRWRYGKGTVKRSRIVVALEHLPAQEFILVERDMKALWDKYKHRRELFKVMVGV